MKYSFYRTGDAALPKARTHGFALLEALIALIVFAVGLLAIAQFHGTLMQTSGQSKASSEALYLAQQKIDELRSVSWEEMESGSEAGLEGTNDVFELTWEVIKDGDLADIRVRVNGSEIDGIQLYTSISRVADIALAQSDGDGTTGTYRNEDGEVELPTDAHEGQTVDGMMVRTDESGEITEIIDPDTGDFLEVPNGSARISGNIFFRGDDFLDNGLPPIQITATGNTLCRVFPGQGLSHSTTFGSYEAIGYSCYVSNGWLGNIVAFPQDPTTQVCIGSPNERPQAFSGGLGGAVERRYFGNRITEEDTIVEIGITGSTIEGKASIGTVCDRDGDCRDTEVEYFVPGGHHFLVKDDSSDCEQAMLQFSEEHVGHENHQADSADNPNNPFYDNPAGLVCTTRPTCGAVTQTRTTFRTRMSGFLDADSNVSTADARMSGGSLECQTFGRLGDGDGSGAYWCPVTDPMRNSAQGVVGAASGSGVEVDELWGYRIERDGQGELIEKRAGRSASSLNIEKILDFNNLGFVLAARDSGVEDDDDDDPPPSGSECTTVVQGNRQNQNWSVSVDLPSSGGSCSYPSNSTYSCSIEALEGETIELLASGPGNQLREFRGTTNCGTINYNF
ncbi:MULTISPECIES: hypothetical protein [unclassified Thioalkalivibrio]|uniref:type IV pilus modification PilV family protein n=1 Tax=unclassified Thioalkalivibrio TaxID=2621013 RepID=UPI000362D102|nr:MULTISPECIES: hypothetical protein [unclassified Thioalkalivibrio]